MLTIGNSEETYRKHCITDRTLIEICEANEDVSGECITHFASMLKKMGVDLIEINSKILLKPIDIPMQWVLFRIEKEDDIQICSKKGISNIIFDYQNIHVIKELSRLSSSGVSITIDIPADAFKNRKILMESLVKSDFYGANTIRISGITDFANNEWLNIIGKVQKYDVQIDICPFDTYFTGTAIACDFIEWGIQNITASFSGYGKSNSYAPVEEILVSGYVLGNSDNQYNLTILPDMARLFSKMTGRAIENNKPVIGSDIFAVESGIHTHGIGKCAITYEPFAPELVGLERRVMIGKHSGRKSIERKLTELGLDSSEYDLAVLLDKVREESITLGRALNDAEIVALL